MIVSKFLPAVVLAAAALCSGVANAQGALKIGVINDQSGSYRDLNGPTSVICTRIAVQEFAAQGFDVEVLSADHQNKPDIAVSIGKQWIDRDGKRCCAVARPITEVVAVEPEEE